MPSVNEPQRGKASFRGDLERERIESGLAGAVPTPAAHILSEQDATEPVHRSRLSRGLSWLWKAPLFAVGGIAALACAIVALGLVLGLLLIGVDKLSSLQAVYPLVALGVVAGGLAIGRMTERAWTRPDGTVSAMQRAGWLVLRVGLICCLAIAAYPLLGFFRVPAANHPAGTLVALGLAAVLGLGMWALLEARRDRDDMAIVPVPAAVLLCAALIGTFVGYQDRTAGELHDYCSYGAISSAQLRGCLDHVTLARIDVLNTDAARFARGPLDSCLADAGPFCAAAKTDRDYQPNQ